MLPSTSNYYNFADRENVIFKLYIRSKYTIKNIFL
jgi:hypothetical protein